MKNKLVKLGTLYTVKMYMYLFIFIYFNGVFFFLLVFVSLQQVDENRKTVANEIKKSICNLIMEINRKGKLLVNQLEVLVSNISHHHHHHQEQCFQLVGQYRLAYQP